MSRRSPRIERTARARGTTPSASEAIATLDAALGCAKRVTGLNSRTRSHSRALSRSPARVAARTVSYAPASAAARAVDASTARSTPLRSDATAPAAPRRRDGARARGGGEAVRKPSRRGGRPAACRRERAGVVRHRSELGVEERRVEGVELLPRRAFVRCGGWAGPQGRDERDDGEGEERSASRPLSAASQFPHPVSVRSAPRLRPGARCRGRLRPARSVPRSRSRAAGPGRPAGLPASA